MSVLKAALGFLATAYANDNIARPRSAGRLAKSYCDRVGKPLLLVRGETLASVTMGDPVDADVTTRRAYPLPFKDKHFGAILVVNVMECLRRPDLALQEWRRVADTVYVVTPSWWSPQSWADPSKRWLVHPDLSKVAPLWTSERSAYLLPVSDKRYGVPRCNPKKKSALMQRPPSPPSSAIPPTSFPSGPPTPPPTPPPTSPALLRQDSSPSLYKDTKPLLDLPVLPTEELPDMDDLMSSGLPDFSQASSPSHSLGSTRALTVVSTQMSDDV